MPPLCRPAKDIRRKISPKRSRAISAMIGKIAKVRNKLRPGLPQATLATNRLKALRNTEKLIKRGRRHDRQK